MSYYKQDLRDVSLKDIDIGRFVAALYNNAMTGGFGLLRWSANPMTAEEGSEIFTSLKSEWVKKASEHNNRPNPWFPFPVDKNGLPYPRDIDGVNFHYINGRSIKTWITWDKNGNNTMSFSRFWDYNHIPVAAILSLAKKGLCGHLTSQPLLDTINEARILVQAVKPDYDVMADFDNAVEMIKKRLQRPNQENFYLEKAEEISSMPQQTYHITFGGNSILKDEITAKFSPSVDGTKRPDVPQP